MSQLRTVYCPNIEFTTSEPVVPLRETVTTESTIICLKKSPNKHNRLFAKAQPLSTELCDAIEANKINILDDNKERAKYLAEVAGWDVNEAKNKVWFFGPEDEPTNTVVDGTFVRISRLSWLCCFIAVVVVVLLLVCFSADLFCRVLPT